MKRVVEPPRSVSNISRKLRFHGGLISVNKNKRLGYRRGILRQRHITLEVKLMNYLQLEDIG